MSSPRRRWLAVLTALSLALPLAVVTSVASANPSTPRTLAHDADGRSTTITARAEGDADEAARLENRSYSHSPGQPTARFVRQGESVTIQTADPRDLAVRIGLGGHFAAYNGGLRTTPWSQKLTSGTTTVVAPRDGMITIVNRSTTRSTEVVVTGGQAVPAFVRGETTRAEFDDQLQRFDAPFVSLIGDRLWGDFQRPIVDAKLDTLDPEALTEFWDTVVSVTNTIYGLHDDAVGVARKHRHRIYVSNPDTGAGGAYATDEYISFQNSSGGGKNLLTPGPSGKWGLFHEIGHTYQNRSMDFAGLGEITVNISSNAVQTSFGLPNGLDVASWKANLKKKRAEIPVDERVYSSADAMVGLWPFEQLRLSFGDQFYARLAGEYRHLAVRGELPVSYDDRRETFARLSADVADRDLGVFFAEHGIHLGDATKAAMSAHPTPTTRVHDILLYDDVAPERILPDYRPSRAVPAVSPDLTLGYLQQDVDLAPEKLLSGLADDDVATATVRYGHASPPTATVAVTVTTRDGSVNTSAIPVPVDPGDSFFFLNGATYSLMQVSLDRSTSTFQARTTGNTAASQWPTDQYAGFEIWSADSQKITGHSLVGAETAKGLVAEIDGTRVEVGQYVVARHIGSSWGLRVFAKGVAVPPKSTMVFRVSTTGLEPVKAVGDPGSGDRALTIATTFDDDVSRDAVASGTATPGREIELTVDGVGQRRLVVPAGGDWSLPVSAVGPGVHQVGVRYVQP